MDAWTPAPAASSHPLPYVIRRRGPSGCWRGSSPRGLPGSALRFLQLLAKETGGEPLHEGGSQVHGHIRLLLCFEFRGVL
ncbi:hypothetical protein CRV15_28925 (plasmid) [Streptomyces clavuligerus]|uniref:Uncharacterized protein n=1 Tax=Streptomyces clavuligerus TaxID=1901 RepID=B5GUE3_STRCL|nr:hypothetical protein SSCG_03193 [Streptomyces clavuligerus]EFG03656.1 Hypothetical protein SCLAV_p0165 [Streptomyces clavuligerus]QCS09666.1 hypothetical protein CRV15_28925 [Streptomyces clavuligerus]QPJ98290.1 hypothetical protein GE265_35435 [Streptomyces clavuligerus]